MSAAPRFLVVDVHAESRFLLVKTLVRKFPGCTVRECDNANEVIELARAKDYACMIVHRTVEVPGIEIVRDIRGLDPEVPIIMVSGIDRDMEARKAGANSFLNYDEWLRIGTVVASHLNKRQPEADAQGVMA